ncbi:putative transporter [Cladobotryum mycophilum]|uniref:Transporter n=1 Tax=Cladobotryum mycophilum TaxID=491253 RepID=A0ABR0SB07_9HYPO
MSTKQENVSSTEDEKTRPQCQIRVSVEKTSSEDREAGESHVFGQGGEGEEGEEEAAAAAYLRQHPEWADYDEQEAKSVLRKIDWRLLPLIIGTTTIGASDKILISNAALYGLSKDTHLVGSQYNWIGTVFYFGWLLSEYPSNAILQKLPVGRTVSAAVFLWGCIMLCHAAAQDAASLMVLRFFMGLLEAPLFPAMVILNSMWYTKKEQPIRTAISFVTLYSLVIGVISYGIGQTHTRIAPWRLLFLVFGGITVLWSVVLFFFLPNSPLGDNFLKGKDKYIALDRVKGNMTGVENRELKWYQVREAFTDYKTYILALFFLCMNVPIGIITFSAQIVAGFGYGKLDTVLLGIPPGLIQSVAGLAVALPQCWLTNMRCLFAAVSCAIGLTCAALLRELSQENKIGRLLSYYCIYFFWGAAPTVLSLPMSNVSGHTKKLTINATLFLAYCIANIAAPQLFFTSEAPRYPTGFSVIVGAECVAILCMAAYALGCIVENRRRDKREGREVYLTVTDQLGDLTDYEKKGFRYVY